MAPVVGVVQCLWHSSRGGGLHHDVLGADGARALSRPLFHGEEMGQRWCAGGMEPGGEGALGERAGRRHTWEGIGRQLRAGE